MADELASDAVLHSHSRDPGGRFGLRLLVCGGESVRVEVVDAGGRWAGPGSAGYLACSGVADGFQFGGRGLRIVGALADTWGVTGDGTGRTVWFTVGWGAMTDQAGHVPPVMVHGDAADEVIGQIRERAR